MAFKDIQKGISRRFSSLKEAANFSKDIRGIIKTLYPNPKTTVRIIDVVHEAEKKRVELHIDKRDFSRVEKDREMIRAALRKEGFDIRSVVVKEY